jgi:hypothetical protein
MGMDSPDPGDGRMHVRISLREIRTLLEHLVRYPRAKSRGCELQLADVALLPISKEQF